MVIKIMLNKSFFLLLSLFLLVFSTEALAWKLEAGSITVDTTTGDISTHINFKQTYSTAPLVFTISVDQKKYQQ